MKDEWTGLLGGVLVGLSILLLDLASVRIKGFRLLIHLFGRLLLQFLRLFFNYLLFLPFELIFMNFGAVTFVVAVVVAATAY